MIPPSKVTELPLPRDEYNRALVRDVAQQILEAISKPTFGLAKSLILRGLKGVLKPALVTLYCRDRWSVSAPPSQVEYALRMLETDGLVSISPDWTRCELTALGKAEALALRDLLRPKANY